MSEQQQQLRECCQDMENRGTAEAVGNGLVKQMCQVCGASHYELEIDAGELFGEGEALNG